MRALLLPCSLVVLSACQESTIGPRFDVDTDVPADVDDTEVVDTVVVDTVVVDTVVLDTEPTSPEVDVTPTHLELGLDVPSGTVDVANTGDGTLHVSALRFDAAAFSSPDVYGFDVAPGDHHTVTVDFGLLGPGTVTGTLTVVSDDADEAEVPVALTATADVPWLEVTPGDVDYGDTLITCRTRETLTFANTGSLALVVDSLSLGGGSSPFLIFDAPRLPFLLAPTESVQVTTQFGPRDRGLAHDTLTAHSNDPRGTTTYRQRGNGVYADVVLDTFHLTPDPPVDVMMVIDGSPSMNNKRPAIAAAIASLTDTLSAVTDDWHLGVVTTGAGCFNSGILTPSSSFATLVSATSAPPDGITEWMFYEAEHALAQTTAGNCNEGFLRPGAPLDVLIISDTNDSGSYPSSLFVGLLHDYVPDARVSAVAGVYSSPCYIETPGTIFQTTAQTTGGLFLSICTAWPSALTQLGTFFTTDLSYVTLSQVPDPSSIQVWLDGVPQTSGWTYDPVHNQIRFQGDPGGATAEVQYGVLGTCP